MASTATITAKVGAGVSLTTSVFNNVTSIFLDTINKALTIEFNNGDGIKKMVIDVNASTTYTLTVSGGNYTLTIT
jgi:hypothetical protein